MNNLSFFILLLTGLILVFQMLLVPAQTQANPAESTNQYSGQNRTIQRTPADDDRLKAVIQFADLRTLEVADLEGPHMEIKMHLPY